MEKEKIKEITYWEPADYFPRKLRKKYKIGEYAQKTENENKEKKPKKKK